MKKFFYDVPALIRVLFILAIGMFIVQICCAEMDIKLSYVGDKYYTSVCNTSKWWDKQVECWSYNSAFPTTEIWNELWILPEIGVSVDSFYRTNLNNGDYNGCVSFDWTRGFKLGDEENQNLKNNAWVENGGSFELGIGGLMTDNSVYFCAVASHRIVFKLGPVFSIGNYIYAYFPIGTVSQVQDDLELKVNVLVGYFNLLYRIETKGITSTSYPVMFFETSF